MAGKKFAAEFALRRNVSALDKILIQDSDDDVVKYAYPPQIAALSGYAYAKSIADLPLMPTNKSIGYIVGQMLYIYVGMGGDTKDGLYQSVGFFVGPQGVQGEKGEKGERGEQGIQGVKGDNGGLSLQELDDYLGSKQYVTGDTLADMLAGYVSNTSLMRDYVTIAKTQDVTGVKNFTAGVQFGGLSMYKSKDDTVFLDGNLVVRGAVTMYGLNTTTSPSIFSALPIDGTTIGRNERGELYVIGGTSGGGGGTGGLDYDMLDDYLTTNGYATQDWVTGKGYITASALEPYALKSAIPTNTNQLTNGAGFITGITSSMVTGALGYTPVAVNMGLTSADNNAIGYGYYEGGWPEAGSAMVFGLGNYKAGISVGAYGSAIRYGYTAGTSSFTWRTILDENNYSNYALPKDGTASAAWKLANARYLWGQLFDGTSNIGGQISFNAGDFILAHNATDAWTDGNGLTHPWYGIDFRAGGSYKGYISHWSGISLVSGNDITLATDKNVVVSKGKLRINQSAFDNGLILNRTAANAGVGIVAMSNDVRLGTFGINGTKTFEISGDNGIAVEISAVNGNILAKGAITMYYSSDKRLKQNIRKVDASKMLMSLGGVHQYEYIDSEVQKNHIYGGTHYGLIYQNVKNTALSSMCHEREDGFGSLNYLDTNFISLIAGATMENISEVEKLKRKIRTLENKVKQLEGRA